MISRTYNKLLVCFALKLIFFECKISANIFKFSAILLQDVRAYRRDLYSKLFLYWEEVDRDLYLEVEGKEARKEKQRLSHVAI